MLCSVADRICHDEAAAHITGSRVADPAEAHVAAQLPVGQVAASIAPAAMPRKKKKRKAPPPPATTLRSKAAPTPPAPAKKKKKAPARAPTTLKAAAQMVRARLKIVSAFRVMSLGDRNEQALNDVKAKNIVERAGACVCVCGKELRVFVRGLGVCISLCVWWWRDS